VACPCFNGKEPLASEDMGHVSVCGGNGGGSEVIAEDTERCDRLTMESEF